jgi:hypothetical protein
MQDEAAADSVCAIVKGEVATHLARECPTDKETQPAAGLCRRVVTREGFEEVHAALFRDTGTGVLDSDLKTVHVLDTQHHAARVARVHQRVIDQVVQNAQRSLLVSLSDSGPDASPVDDNTAMEQAGPRLGSFGCRPSDLSEIDVVVAPSTWCGAIDTTERQNVVDEDASLLQLQAEHLERRAPRVRCRPEAPVRQHREISTGDTEWGSQIVDDLDDLVRQRSDGVSDHGYRSMDLQLPRGSPAAQSRTSKLYIGTIHKLYAPGPKSASGVLKFPANWYGAVPRRGVYKTAHQHNVPRGRIPSVSYASCGDARRSTLIHQEDHRGRTRAGMA